MEVEAIKQEDVCRRIQKAFKNYKKSPKDRITPQYIQIRIDILDDLWKEFGINHRELIKLPDYKASTYFQKEYYDVTEELYVEYKTELTEELAKFNKKLDDSSVDSGCCKTDKRNTSKRTKLPEVKIPVFSGRYSEFATFRDLFLGLVHNDESLNDAEKFYYLKGQLTGEAELLLKNIKVTSENYLSAWNKLEKMYNNKKFIVKEILKRLVHQKCLLTESASEIKKLITTTLDCLDSIKNLGIDISTWDVFIVFLITEKLDKETRKAWELKTSSDPSDELPSIEQLSEFLFGRFRGLENIDDNKVNLGKSQGYKSHGYKGTTASFYVKENKEAICAYCSDGHKLYLCKRFGKESNANRRKFVQEKGLCFICLGINHSARFCKNTFRCQVCKGRHHSLLHSSGGFGSRVEDDKMGILEVSSITVPTKEGGVNQQGTTQAGPSGQQVGSYLATGNCKEKTVLLTTAVVKAESKNGSYKLVRALLDQGSQGSFITEATAQYLGLKKVYSNHTITGVGDSKSVHSRYVVTLNLQSRLNRSFTLNTKAYVLKSITSLLPLTKVTGLEWVKVIEEDLADPEYHRPNKIDVLLGAEIYSQILKGGFKRSPGGAVIAQDTSFGWILSGVVDMEVSSNDRSHIVGMHSAVDSDNLLWKFWELEAEPPGKKKLLTDEEIKCEQFFVDTTRRDNGGRYIVRLPFRNADPDCKRGESKVIAGKRFNSLEGKFERNDKFREDYMRVLKEYVDLGHMVKVTKEETHNTEAVYLPHHAVLREDKETTKVRVVLDASCKGKNGVSLNDDLMIGPTLQADLRHTVMRWRMHPIGLVADIIKMYRQVWVDRQDTVFQRILWRDSPEKEIEEYELLTVTFGTASAPYLAVRTLQQVAHDEGSDHPAAAKVILNSFYMDDMMSGAENIREAYELYIQMNSILGKAGFQLQKWASNSEELMNKIKEGKQDEELRIKEDNLMKILGLTWVPREDVFKYSVDLPPLQGPATKRKVISDISRLYDPLGWLAPSIVRAKMLIQKLWLAGIGWDQEVPRNLITEWLTYRQALTSLMDIKIPRWIFTSAENVKVELHGFSDSSKLAYSAVVYVRVISAAGNIEISLVASKTKVAPIKQVSIPRLELCGAVLLAKLMVEVAEVMGVPTNDLYAWTDSEVVLAWLNSHPSRWKTFVANRVADILLTLDTQHWSHVPSKQNPADCASRGISPAELAKNHLWFNGPKFLKQPVIEFKRSVLVTKLEEIKTHVCTAVNDFTLWTKFSSLYRLIRVIAYCKRFLNLLSRAHAKPTRFLLRKELEDALEVCVKRSQTEGLEEGDRLTKKWKSLNLFTDSKGIVRVGGRLEMSQLDYHRKHPILIPKESFLTNLLIHDAHHKTLHGGPQIMITYLRSTYWIIGVKVLVKAFVRKCVTCIRYAAKTRSQLMGQLPSPRVTPNNKPFLSSGVDYAGPINIRVSKGRGNKSYKGYIVLFVCMATRAIHLEAVSDLTSKGFLTAFKRFVARRGRCADLHSDNGTNFVGASRELQDLFNEERSSIVPELVENLANNGTQWHFIPPHAPNFGGLWEAGIKSTKHHLKRIIGNSTLTFEEMATVLAQIEACLNSRPLSCVEDPNEVLTPGHFLVGEPLVLAPDFNFEHSNVHTLRRWQLTQRMLQDFWRRWSQDYLQQFLQRRKWTYQNPEPAIGDIVLVKEDSLPPGRWLLGKVERKHPGPDGLTRVVTLKVQDSVIKRPTSKICILTN